MCKRHSFIVTRAGKVIDGYGLTDSHTTIREIAGLTAENDSVNAYEWQAPAGWPNADFLDGLTKDTEVFEPKASHIRAMDTHVRTIYPTTKEWDLPDVVRELPKTCLQIKGDLVIPPGATFTAPVLVEVSGSVDVRQGATFTAPKLKRKK